MLERIVAQTLAHYEQNAESFWQGTRHHDVSQNIAPLLQYVEAPPPFDLVHYLNSGDTVATEKDRYGYKSGRTRSQNIISTAKLITTAPPQPNQVVFKPDVKRPITDFLLARNIRPTMMGTATTPLMTALQ